MRSGNWNSAYKGLQSRLTMGLFRLLYIAGSQRPVKIDELRHATTIWTPGDLPHRHWPSYRTKTICFALVMFIYLIYVGRVLPVHNQLLDGYTRPHWHSTRPKDGWAGPWMRQCIRLARRRGADFGPTQFVYMFILTHQSHPGRRGEFDGFLKNKIKYFPPSKLR